MTGEFGQRKTSNDSPENPYSCNSHQPMQKVRDSADLLVVSNDGTLVIQDADMRQQAYMEMQKLSQ